MRFFGAGPGTGRGWLLDRLLALADRRPPPEEAPASAERILVVAYEHQLGSIVAITPALSALRAAFPAAHIEVLGTPLLAEVLGDDPRVAVVTATADPHDAPVRAVFQAWRGVYPQSGAQAGSRFDLLLSTVGNRRGAVGLIVLRQPAVRRVGHGPPAALARFEAPLAYDGRLSMAANSLRAVAALAGNLQEPPPPPRLYFSAAARARAEGLLRAEGVDPGQPLAVLVVQTSGGQPTAWDPARLAAVVEALSRRHGLLPLFVGTAAGAAAIAAVRDRLTVPSRSLAGRTPIPDLAALMAGADLGVALDTGAMHVARAVGLPLVVIASAWQPGHHWLPAADGGEPCVVLARRDLPCAPCHRPVCAHRDCLMAISAAEVVEAAGRLLAVHPPGAGEGGRGARLAAGLSPGGPAIRRPGRG